MAINTTSDTWTAVREHCTTEIESARKRLEAKGFQDTEFERGRIAALRDVMKLVKEDPLVKAYTAD